MRRRRRDIGRRWPYHHLCTGGFRPDERGSRGKVRQSPGGRTGLEALDCHGGSEDKALTLLRLIDDLEDNDDVQSVAANFEIADDVIERLVA